MSDPALPDQEGRTDGPAAGPIERLSGAIAIVGGLTTLAVALLATASIVMRWLFNAPIDGDFEYVKMATAVAVFAYLPYAQARHANIMVDTFTGRLPRRTRALLDAAWDLVYAGIMAYLTWCLVHGTAGFYRSGETTMQRLILIWPSMALCTALAALVVITAVATAVRLVSASARRSAP